MGTGSEQIPAGIAGKTVAARCLSPFSTVLGIHRPKRGQAPSANGRQPQYPECDGASPHFRTPGSQFELHILENPANRLVEEYARKSPP